MVVAHPVAAQTPAQTSERITINVEPKQAYIERRKTEQCINFDFIVPRRLQATSRDRIGLSYDVVFCRQEKRP